MHGLSLVAASGGHSSSRCAGLSLSRPLLLRSAGSRRAGSVIVAHGPSCSAACGIFPDQGSNPCPLHSQADLNHCATREAHDIFYNWKFLHFDLFGPFFYPPPPLLGTTILFPVFMSLVSCFLFFNISHKSEIIQYLSFCLTYLINSAFEVHPCCHKGQDFILFYG